MTNHPLVSIALCTYNGAKYLQQQLDTLINQSYQNLEIIITDDGSSDETMAILEQYAAIDKRLNIYRNEQNLGYVKNFEKAIGLCRGNYIALADQDDIWDLNKTELMLNAIGDAILIYHDSEFISDEGKSLGKMSGKLNMYSGNDPLALLFYNCISGHSCMFKAELVPHFGAFNPKFYHDWWLAFVAANVGRIAYLDKLLVKYRQHPQAVTDMLNIGNKAKKFTRKFEEVNRPWLEQCSSFDGKRKSVIQQLLHYYHNDGLYSKLRVLDLLVRYTKPMFFIKKKSYKSKLNYIRKMAFSKRY